MQNLARWALFGRPMSETLWGNGGFEEASDNECYANGHYWKTLVSEFECRYIDFAKLDIFNRRFIASSDHDRRHRGTAALTSPRHFPNSACPLQLPIVQLDLEHQTSPTSKPQHSQTDTETKMKFSISFVTLFLSSLVASKGLSFLGGGQSVLGDGGEVPGDNPLTFCKADHSSDILTLEKVNLTPNPPVACVFTGKFWCGTC